MTWIKTVPLSEASEPLLHALDAQRALYPKEYANPVGDEPMLLLNRVARRVSA